MIGRGGGGGLRCASGAVAWCVGGLPEVLLFQVVNVESEGVNGPPGFAGRLSALRGGCAPGVPDAEPMRRSLSSLVSSAYLFITLQTTSFPSYALERFSTPWLTSLMSWWRSVPLGSFLLKR